MVEKELYLFEMSYGHLLPVKVVLWEAHVPFFLERNVQCICHDGYQLLMPGIERIVSEIRENQVKLVTALVYVPVSTAQ